MKVHCVGFLQDEVTTIPYELCFQMMLYMLFNNSLAPCIPRLARNSWKLGNASGCQVGGDIKGLIRGT